MHSTTKNYNLRMGLVITLITLSTSPCIYGNLDDQSDSAPRSETSTQIPAQEQYQTTDAQSTHVTMDPNTKDLNISVQVVHPATTSTYTPLTPEQRQEGALKAVVCGFLIGISGGLGKRIYIDRVHGGWANISGWSLFCVAIGEEMIESSAASVVQSYYNETGTHINSDLLYNTRRVFYLISWYLTYMTT